MINNMTAVILVIDELIDQGIVMSTDPSTILKRINIKTSGTVTSGGTGGSGSISEGTGS